MKLQCEDRYRPTVAVIRGVVDELIVDTEVRPAEHTDTVESFDYLLRTGVGQSSVTDDAAQPPGGEIKLALMRDPVDGTCQSERVVGPAPSRAGQRQPARD